MTGIYDVETLRQDWAAGGCHKFLFFWKTEAEADGSLGPGCLGQWWPSRFTIGGGGILLRRTVDDGGKGPDVRG